MSFSYATPTSGPSAGGIGWYNFDSLTISPGTTLKELTGTLKNGCIVTFDLSLSHVSGQPCTFSASSIEANQDSFFGNTSYTNLEGNVSLYPNFSVVEPGISTLTLSNITVVEENNNPVSNFTVILADGGMINYSDGLDYQTNGGNWNLFGTIGKDYPNLIGIDTKNVSIAGTLSQSMQASCLLSTQSPSQIIITLTQSAQGQQGISIGFATTRIRVEKYVAERVQDADQFKVDILGMPSDQVITTGTANGIQSQVASVYAIPGNTYSIAESMAPGSISQLYQYTTVVSASNASQEGSLVPTGNLPISFTPVLGDDVTYTVYNQVSYTYHKTVNKSYAEIGELLTYTVFIPNPNPYPITDVKFTDAIPTGTTYMGNLRVDKAYTGIAPDSGLIINSIPANGSVDISWDVQINTVQPIVSPIVNVAYVDIPSGNSGVTSFATTEVKTAHVTMHKNVDKAFAHPNDWLTYTITLYNAGNVVANEVIVTDTLPMGVTLVPGSLTGASGNFPNLVLNAPLGARSTATVSYQVKINNSLPEHNPIVNSASAVFHYTVDPDYPNVKTGNASSNDVTTLVQEAELLIRKSANCSVTYLGENIAYDVLIKNIGNVSANNVILTKFLPMGTVYVSDSLKVSVPSTGDPTTEIVLTDSIAPDETITISFRVIVASMPITPPLQSSVTADFTYGADNKAGNAQSNTIAIPVLRNNFGYQVNDIINSVAQQQAALAAIINAEGSKIQRMTAMNEVSHEELLCLNKSVTDMIDSITMLESVLKQKLSILECQINGEAC